MKQLLKSTFLSLFISTLAFSQSIEKLDEKNGFKDFKLGDTFYKWQNSLTYLRLQNNVKRYKYNGSCCNTIYEYPLDSIMLDFVDNKLIQINLLHKAVPARGSYIKSDISKIYSKLINSFGVFTTKDTSNDSKMFLFWIGKKVDLLYVYTYLGVSEGQKYEVIIFDKVYTNKRKSEGF